MAETKQPLILALGRGYNGFYCPKTRFHLVGVIKPQAVYPAELPLSQDVKRGLRGGTLVDVNGVLTAEDIQFKEGESETRTSADVKKEILVQAEESVTESQGEDETYVAPDFSNQKDDLISEADILSATKKELLEFIDKNEIDQEELGLNSRSTAEEVKEALMTYFGYNEKPKDFKDEE